MIRGLQIRVVFKDEVGNDIVEPEVQIQPCVKHDGEMFSSLYKFEPIQLSRHLLVELIRKIDEEPRPSYT